MKRIKLGIIGAGIFAHRGHLPALASLSHLFEIGAVCSRSRKKAEELARAVGMGADDAVTDPSEILSRPDIDAAQK